MRVSAKHLLFEALALLVVAVLAAAGFAAWRLSQGPVDLGFMKPMVERSMAEARGGQPVKIDKLQLEWSPSRDRIEIAARGVAAMDKKGTVISRAERAAITLDTPALFAGKIKTRAVRLENGEAVIRRSKQGVWTLASIELMREPKSDKPFDPLNDIKWATIAQPIRALVTQGAFEQMGFENFTVKVHDDASGASWSATPVTGAWTADKTGVNLNLSLKLAGSVEPNAIKVAVTADAGVKKAKASLTLDGVDPHAVAEMFGVKAENFTSGRPANATFTVEASEAGGIQTTKLALTGVSGHAQFETVDINVQDLTFEAAYDPTTRKLDLTSANIVSDRVTGAFTGSVDLVQLMSGNRTAPTPFRLAAKDLTLNVTPVFEAPWSIGEATVEGAVSADFSRVQIAKAHAVTGEMVADANGELWLEGPPDARHLGAKLAAKAGGVATVQQVTEYWPVNLGSSGRNWVKTHIPSGKATNLDFTIDWPPGGAKGGELPDERLKLTFDILEADVKYLPDFPAATKVVGKGLLMGNSLVIDASAGSVDRWQVDEGKISIPKFHGPKTWVDVVVSGRGDLRDLMRSLNATSLKVGEKYGLAVDQMGGTGGLELTLRVPTHDGADGKGMTYMAKGGFRGAAAPDLAAGFGITESDVRIELSQDGMLLAGAGKFGPAPVVFDWKEDFFPATTGKPSQSALTASAIVTPDLLNAFGLAARNFMQGEGDLKLRASGSGRNFTSITADVDLTKAAIDISELGWTKKFDAPARGTFKLGEREANVLTGEIKADGLELSGEARLTPEGALQSARIARIFSRGSVDLKGDIARQQDGGYKLAVSGPFFDASPWTGDLLNMGARSHPAPQATGAAVAEPTFDVTLAADNLMLREGAELRNARVALELASDGPRTGHITGMIGEGKTVDVKLGMDGAARTLAVKADDAGFAGKVLLNSDFLSGGKLNITGRFSPTGGDANVTMSDVRMKDAPLIAQLFSFASLRGLADTLSGDGVLFTKVEAPLKMVDGRIDLKGLRASGPALGITARGWVVPDSGAVALDGVLVPSYGLNSALGGIPVFGDLFVSRKGEGLFAPTYTVRGSLAEAQVAMNPIAAVTPGFLRRIFENPAEPPPLAQAAPDVRATAAN